MAFKPITGFQKITPITITKSKPKGNPTYDFAKEVATYFGLNIGLILKMIKYAGEDNVRYWMGDSKMSKNQVARFMFLWKEYYGKIKWEKV